MSNTLRSGETRELSLASGQSIAISTIAGAVTADVVAGTSKGTNLLSASTGGGTFGPYASGAVVRIVVAEGGIVDYDIGTAPVNSYNQNAKLAFDSSGNTVGIADPVTGKAYNIARGAVILNGASAGADSGWLPMSDAPERFAYQLDSGSTATTFSVDISADGVTSLGQAFTGTWASSTLAEITFPIMFSNPLAKFFRWNVVSGGPLSVSRGV